MSSNRAAFSLAIVASFSAFAVACLGESTTASLPDAASTTSDSGAMVDAGSDAVAPKVLADGLLEPVPYLQKSDSPFREVSFPSYFHLEDWEDSVLNTPGATSDSSTVSTSFGSALVDSIDGDDGVVDGKCAKDGGTCNAAFGGGTISFTFDATVLGKLPTHVGAVWTDGSTGCDAIFEAYDAKDVLIGTKKAVAVGDDNNTGGVAEDRFFGVVHAAGVKRVVVKSSAGGVEVDHLQYGR